MKKTVLFVLFCFTLLSLYAQDYKKVKVFLSADKSELQVLGRMQFDLEHSFLDKNNELSLFMSDDEYVKFLKLSYRHEVLINKWSEFYKNRLQITEEEKSSALLKSKQLYGVQGFSFGSMGGHYTLAEVNTKLDSLRIKYPNLISAKLQIGLSVEGRPIYAVRISKTPDINGTCPQVLYTGLHHAREPEGMMAMIYYMYYLLENYSTNTSVKYLVDNREIWFVPVVNPDGYEYNHSTNASGGGMWRKNRKNNADTSKSFGVDINRNYGPQAYWDAANDGSSAVPSDETFRGTAPFSEPETKALKDFIGTKKFKTALNYHTYSNMLIFPYGAIPHETPDSLIFREFASDMTAYDGYTIGTDLQTVGYSTRGNSDDYMYDGDTLANGKIFSMTPEVGTNTDGFWAPQIRIIPIAQENLFPNLYFTWVAGEYISLKKASTFKESYNPGDTVNVMIQLGNKGLSVGKNISTQLVSLSTSAVVNTTAAVIDSLAGRTLYSFSKPFSISILPTAPVYGKLKFVLNTLLNQVPMASDTFSISLGRKVYSFYDSAKTLATNWTITSSPATQKWDTTSSAFVSAPTCFADSRVGTYISNSTVTMSLKTAISLVGMTNPFLGFKTKFDIESQYDCGVVLISTDNGTTWTPIAGQYTKAASGLSGSKQTPAGMPVYDGLKSDWVTEEINLSAYAGKSIKIRFELRTDSGLDKDGWYLDDINIYSYAAVTAVSPVNNDLPKEFSLEQNYPNPFNPVTEIRYAIPGAERVSLKVFNVLGKEVAVLVNSEYRSAGFYKVAFNASSLPSGTYIYRLEAGANVTSKKLILIK